MHRLRQVRLLTGIAGIAGMMLPGPGILTSAQQQKSTTFSQLAEKAKKASEESRLDEAAALYTRALALRPRWAEGWWSLGTLEYDRDHYAKAAADFAKLTALQPENGTAYAMLGLCQFELGRNESALQNLKAAERLGVVKNEDLRRVAVYHFGLLQLRAGKFMEARETLSRLAQEGLRTKELNLALGEAALLVRPQEAPSEGTDGARILERAGEAEASSTERNFKPALQIYKELVNEYPDYRNLHFAFGTLLLAATEPEQAVQEFQFELKRDPQDVNCLLEIAAVRYRTDSADGVKYAEEAVKLDPRRPFGHYLLGLLYLDTENYSRAISELEIARRSHPNFPEIYFALGNAYARSGRRQEAAQARATFQRLNAADKKDTIELSTPE